MYILLGYIFINKKYHVNDSNSKIIDDFKSRDEQNSNLSTIQNIKKEKNSIINNKLNNEKKIKITNKNKSNETIKIKNEKKIIPNQTFTVELENYNNISYEFKEAIIKFYKTSNPLLDEKMKEKIIQDIININEPESTKRWLFRKKTGF